MEAKWRRRGSGRNLDFTTADLGARTTGPRTLEAEPLSRVKDSLFVALLALTYLKLSVRVLLVMEWLSLDA